MKNHIKTTLKKIGLWQAYYNLAVKLTTSTKKYTDHGIFELVPEISGRRLLYVGFSDWRGTHMEPYMDWFIKAFLPRGFYDMYVLEIWPANVEFAKRYLRCEIKIDQGTVLSTPYHDKYFDVAVWLDGPEHVAWHELDHALKELERVTRGWIVIGCPDGYCSVDMSQHVNPFQSHLSAPDKLFFEKRGYKVKVQKKKLFEKCGHLTAVKDVRT